MKCSHNNIHKNPVFTGHHNFLKTWCALCRCVTNEGTLATHCAEERGVEFVAGCHVNTEL